MAGTDDSNPFASAETYYAEYRPGYGDAAIQYLSNWFGLGESSRVLDLGCGTGQIAIPLAGHVGEVVGMDPNEQMLQKAEKCAESAGIENVEWVVGSDADLSDDLGSFQLATMGRSFHWMNQQRTLDRLHAMLEPGGGVASLTDAEWFIRGANRW